MLGIETVGFERSAGEDDDGNQLPSTTWEVENCDVQSGSGTETLGTDRSAAAQTATVFLPAGAPPVDHRVTLTIRGVPGWRIVGDPLDWIDDENDRDLEGPVLVVTRGKG